MVGNGTPKISNGSKIIQWTRPSLSLKRHSNGKSMVVASSLVDAAVPISHGLKNLEKSSEKMAKKLRKNTAKD